MTAAGAGGALETALERCQEAKATVAWCASMDATMTAGFDSRAEGVDAVADEIRMRYLTHAWSLPTADHAINMLAGYAQREGVVPSVFWQTYLTFDESEFTTVNEAVLRARLSRTGDRVARDPDTWQPSEFDNWGRGAGVGKIVESPIPLSDVGIVDVRWDAGRCAEEVLGLLWIRHVDQ